MAKKTGAQVLAATLAGYDVDHVFYVPAVLLSTMVEMEDLPIRRILAHSEKAAAYMADGYARATGKPGICFSQNIGSSNLASGLRDAKMAKSPVIAISGGPSPKYRYRNYYQEIEDFSQFDAVTKFNGEINDVTRLPDMLRQAFRIATSGAPGPVHLRLPGVSADDTLNDLAELDTIIEARFKSVPAFRVNPDAEQIDAAVSVLKHAQRPIIVAGGGVVSSGAKDVLLAFAEKHQIPVATSLNSKGTIPEDHPLSVGVVGNYSRACANKALSLSDLVIFVGSQTGSQVTTRWNVPALSTSIVHIDIEPSELGRNYPNTTPILADAKTAIVALDRSLSELGAVDGDWLRRVSELVKEWRAEAREFQFSDAVPMRPERVCRAVSESLPDDAIVVSDTGHSGMWSGVMIDLLKPKQRYIRCAGSLGWALPASLGVKCGCPDRPVLCFAGDGAVYYHLAELETAARHGINVVILINNNNALNQEIQLYRETTHGKKAFSDELWRFNEVRFSDLARTMGCAAFRVEQPSDLSDVLKEAFSMNRPVIVEAITDVGAEAQNAWLPPKD